MLLNKFIFRVGQKLVAARMPLEASRSTHRMVSLEYGNDNAQLELMSVCLTSQSNYRKLKMPFLVEASCLLPSLVSFKCIDADEIRERNNLKHLPLRGLGRGKPVEPELVPRIAEPRPGRGGRKLYDVFPTFGASAVSSRFRDLVEDMEPGVHQFFELELRQKDGSPFPGQYYAFNCCQQIDTILVRESRLEWEKETGHRPRISLVPSDVLVTSGPERAGRHLWRELYVARSYIMASDAFMIEMRKRKLIGLQIVNSGKEVDVPYDAEEQVGPLLAWLRENPTAPLDPG